MFWFLLLETDCTCTDEHNIVKENKKVGAHCAQWENGDTNHWCYLRGGENAKKCAGAQKSSEKEGVYWSADPEVCLAKGEVV